MERKGISDEDVVAGGNGKGPPPPPAAGGIFAARCRLCQVSKETPGLYVEIHGRRFRDQWSYRDILNELNGRITRGELDARPFNLSTFTSHFTKHVSADQRYISATQQAHRPQQDEQLMAQVLEYKRTNVEKLQGSFRKWELIATRLFKGIEEGEGPPSRASIEGLRDATDAMAKLSGALDKCVRDRSFVMNVVGYAIHQAVTLHLVNVNVGLVPLRAEAGARADPAVVDWVFARLEKIGTEATEPSMRQARKNTKEMFNL